MCTYIIVMLYDIISAYAYIYIYTYDILIQSTHFWHAGLEILRQLAIVLDQKAPKNTREDRKGSEKNRRSRTIIYTYVYIYRHT